MMSLTKVTVLTTLFYVSTVTATPSYKDTKQVYDAIEKTIASSNIWWQQTTAAQVQARRDAIALHQKAQIVFTDSGSQCLLSASLHMDYVRGLQDLAEVANGQPLKATSAFISIRRAVELGKAQSLCLDEINGLKK
jgi:hypothetical protein